MLSIMAAAMSGASYGDSHGSIFDEPRHIPYKPKTKEELEREQIDFYKRKGLREWTINGCVVWAATKKAARKKAGL